MDIWLFSGSNQMTGRKRSWCHVFGNENNKKNEASKLKMHHFRPNSIKEEWERTRKLLEKCIASKGLIPAKKMKHFDEKSTTIIVTLTTLNHFQVNKKDTSFADSSTKNGRSYC